MNFERQQDIRAQTEWTLGHVNVLHNDVVRPSVSKGIKRYFDSGSLVSVKKNFSRALLIFAGEYVVAYA